MVGLLWPYKLLEEEVIMMDNKDGVWRTISGRRIFIAEGQSLTEAMSKSKKFDKSKFRERLRKSLSKDKKESEGQRDSLDIDKYNCFEDLIRDKSAIEILKREGINNIRDARVKYNQTKLDSQQITSVNLEKAVDNIRNKIPWNVRDGWFTKADSNYKVKLNDIIVNDPEIRSSGLAIAYDGFKRYSGRDLNFQEFLETELTLYRGTRGQKTVSADDETFMSYSYDKSIANKFGKNIETITIKAKDTLGMYQTTGEYEILVPTSKIKKREGDSDD